MAITKIGTDIKMADTEESNPYRSAAIRNLAFAGVGAGAGLLGGRALGRRLIKYVTNNQPGKLPYKNAPLFGTAGALAGGSIGVDAGQAMHEKSKENLYKYVTGRK